jgi:hypothetical protein
MAGWPVVAAGQPARHRPHGRERRRRYGPGTGAPRARPAPGRARRRPTRRSRPGMLRRPIPRPPPRPAPQSACAVGRVGGVGRRSGRGSRAGHGPAQVPAWRAQPADGQQEWGMDGQARSSELVMGLDNPHDHREPCLFYIQLGPPTRLSPTRQARTMPRPWRPRRMAPSLSLDRQRACRWPSRQLPVAEQQADLLGRSNVDGWGGDCRFGQETLCLGGPFGKKEDETNGTKILTANWEAPSTRSGWADPAARRAWT